MRTTLTLEDDLGRRLSELADERGLSFKSVVNMAIRRGLDELAPQPSPGRFRVEAHPCSLRIGIDDRRFNQLVDDLEALGFLERQSE